MLIAQISDPHVIEEGLALFGQIDTNGFLDQAMEAILGLKPRPDAVLVTGDLTNDGTEAQMQALMRRLRRLPMPVLVIPGNHDTRAGLRAAAPDWPWLGDAGPICYTRSLGPVEIVALDSLVEGEHGGRLGPDQLAWLDTTLAARPESPTLVMLHHPPFATGLVQMDAAGLADADALASVIARHAQVERVLCGHLHRPIQARFAGTLALTAPSCAHQVALRFDEAGPTLWRLEPPAMLLHRFTPELGFVTHQAYIGDHGPDRSFGGANLPLAAEPA